MVNLSGLACAGPTRLGAFFHVGIVVSDIGSAMAALGAPLNLTWNSPHESRYGPWRILVSYSREGPPWIELVEGEPGGAWDTNGTPRIDHLGYWSEDLEADQARLEADGLPVVVDGIALGGRFSYHQALGGGIRIELVDAVHRPAITGRE